MAIYSANTPEGTRDRLFAECRERRQVQRASDPISSGSGDMREVITPEVEYYDLFIQSGNPLPQEAMLKLIDRSGRIMVMRPDCTTPIARVAATKLKTVPLPQRLYYDQTVFRSGDAHRGGSSEIAQCGVELIGAGGEKGRPGDGGPGGGRPAGLRSGAVPYGAGPCGLLPGPGRDGLDTPTRTSGADARPASRARISPPSTTCSSPTGTSPPVPLCDRPALSLRRGRGAG